MRGEPPTVLLTTVGLHSAAGTDLYTRDLASALLRLHWRPVVYTLLSGAVAEEVRRRTVPVIDDLGKMTVVPDVIHGHHGLETLTALLTYPAVPAVFVTHDGRAWNSIPPVMNRIRAYVAVDENCRDRMVCEYGIPLARTCIMANAVDLQRFQPRPPLPARPVRALVFSNAAREDTFVLPVRQACAARGIALHVMGAGEGTQAADPENRLPEYDLVFAKGRCALEALAVGTAVVLCDYGGLGTLVTANTVEHLRRLNFGMRTLQREVTRAAVGEEIDRYEPSDAARASELIRRAADVDLLALQFIAIYDEITREPVTADLAGEAQCVARYLRTLSAGLYAKPAAQTIARRVLERLRRSRMFTPVAHRIHRWVNLGT